MKKMNELVRLNFPLADKPIRMVYQDGEPWWVGKDVCEALQIAKHRDAMARLDDDEGRPVLVDTLGGRQSMSAVNESGLYNLIFTSRTEMSQAFRKWVTSEVLPSIRKHGYYGKKDGVGLTDAIPKAGVGNSYPSYDMRREIPGEVSINSVDVTAMEHEGVRYLMLKEVILSTHAQTKAGQVVKMLNKAGFTPVKIALYGMTNPAWFVTDQMAKIVMKTSRRLRASGTQMKLDF